MSSVELLVPSVDRSVRRFGVAWRNRVQRANHDVAVLDFRSGTYRFQYLSGVGESIEGFRPFIGFSNLDRVYESSRLWPFFDLRVMDRKRPDFPRYVGWLGLPPDADRLDILSRSGGEQKGDTVSLAEAPKVADDGATEATFLIRGSSYAVRSHGSISAAHRLRPGDELAVIDDETNEANPNALLLTTDGAPVGWVPDLLIDFARELLGGDCSATVLQNNGPGAPWHMRLLVRLAGRVAPGWAAFSDGVWPPMPERPPA